jgi:hypothetical protein
MISSIALELIWTGGMVGQIGMVTEDLFRRASNNFGTIADYSILMICTDISFPDTYIPDCMKDIRFEA